MAGVTVLPAGAEAPGLPQVNLPTFGAPPQGEPAVIDVTPKADSTVKIAGKEVYDPFAHYTPEAAPKQPEDPFAGYKPPEAAPPSVTPAPIQELRNQPWYQPFQDFVGGLTGSISHGATLGMDEIIAPIPAAIATSLMQGIPFSKAYDDQVAKMRQPRTNFEAKNPILGGAVEMAAGLPATAATAPLFGTAKAGAGAVQKAINAARNIVASTGTGAATGFTMTDGDVNQRLQGAKEGAIVGGALGAAAPAASKVIASDFRAVRPNATAPTIAGEVLTENAPPGTTFQPSPVPAIPLNVAQSSGSPELASLVDRRNAANVPAMKREVDAQNAGALGALQGARGEPTVFTPTVRNTEVAGHASTQATGAIRRAADIIGSEERRLWNTPALSQPNVSSSTSKEMIDAALSKMRRDTPGLADAYDHSPLPAVVKDLNAMPDKVAANELNSISSRFRAIARDPNQDGNVRMVARDLASIAQDGIWQAPEVAGRPATQRPHTWLYDKAGNRTPVMDPAIPPNPDLVRDLKAARAFTKREAETLGHASFDNILKRNSRGNETATEGTAMARFFDFAAGVERPGSISNVTKFLDDIKSEWIKLNNANQFSPAFVDAVKDDLIENSRNYIIAKMLDRVSGVATDATGERRIQFGQLNKWLEKNRGLLQRSGMFDGPQLDLLDRLAQTARMIHRGDELGRSIGSPTYTRLIGDKYADLFIGALTGRIAGATTGAALGAAVEHMFPNVGIGALIGAEIAGVASGDTIARAIYSKPRAVVLQKLDEAIRDPVIAADLMKRASDRAKINERTRDWVRSFLAVQPVAEMARVNSAPSLPAPEPAR